MDEFLAELTQPVYRFLLRLTGEPELAADLTQEALLRAWRERHRLKAKHAARTWVFRIAVNAWKDDRRASTGPLSTAFDPDAAVDASAIPVDTAMERELEQAVIAAIDRLPNRQRQVTYLRFVEEMSTREIGNVLGISHSAVRSNLAAGRKHLRAMLRGYTHASR